MPAAAKVTDARTREEPVAPSILLPFFFHWYVSGVVPEATTRKVADPPTVRVWLAGAVVMVGAAAVTGL